MKSMIYLSEFPGSPTDPASSTSSDSSSSNDSDPSIASSHSSKVKHPSSPAILSKSSSVGRGMPISGKIGPYSSMQFFTSSQVRHPLLSLSHCSKAKPSAASITPVEAARTKFTRQ